MGQVLRRLLRHPLPVPDYPRLSSTSCCCLTGEAGLTKRLAGGRRAARRAALWHLRVHGTTVSSGETSGRLEHTSGTRWLDDGTYGAGLGVWMGSQRGTRRNPAALSRWFLVGFGLFLFGRKGRKAVAMRDFNIHSYEPFPL